MSNCVYQIKTEYESSQVSFQREALLVDRIMRLYQIRNPDSRARGKMVHLTRFGATSTIWHTREISVRREKPNHTTKKEDEDITFVRSRMEAKPQNTYS